MSPQSRSMAKMKKAGYLVGGTEKFVRFPPPGHRVDLFGFVDLIAVKGDSVIAIQTTSGDNTSKRVAKICANPNAAMWLSSPTRTIMVHGWAKRGGIGKRKLWDCREVEVTFGMVNVNPATL